MSRLLVVDDEEDIVGTVGDILYSHGYEHDAAGDQETAKNMLAPGKYDGLILDLDIPAGPDRLSRPENGRNLLRHLRQTPGLERLPVIVITGRDNGDLDFIINVMKDGHGGWTDYVRKPIHGDKLDKAIRDALTTQKEPLPVPSAITRQLEPFTAAKREMVIYEDRVTLCGVEVWRDSAQPDLLKALVMLSERDPHGFVRLRGSKLNKTLDRNASNPISKPLERFCKRASEILLAERGLECGRYDIVGNSAGGYHFTNWMTVRVAGSSEDEPGETGNEPREPKNEPAETGREPVSLKNETGNETNEPDREADGPLNERQQWILEQVRKGTLLRLKDVIPHFHKNRSTINRDLHDLRKRGLIRTDENGYYLSANAGRRGQESASDGRHVG